MRQYFQFKQFSIRQEQSAQKVGTDGVLLGAWAQTCNPNHILDIGTGTGLIALMLAQRYSMAQIHALEIDPMASQDARLNFEAAPWTDRIELFEEDVNQWKAPVTYDLIVSNPPYFQNGLKPASDNRRQARHQDSLNLVQLFHRSAKMITQNGQLCIILPSAWDQKVLDLLQIAGWFIREKVGVYSDAKAPRPKRTLWRFSKMPGPSGESQFYLYESEWNKKNAGSRAYSQAFIQLTKAFYLQF
ncbi:MAG: methyltransferase [Bacteroidota bacterium]